MLVGNDAAAICDRIYAIFPDHAREARRIQSDTDLGIALLQVIQGGPFVPLLPSSKRAAVGDPVTLFGFPAQRVARPVPAAAAGVVWLRDSQSESRVVMANTLPLRSGVMLDGQGAVLGMIDPNTQSEDFDGHRQLVALDQGAIGKLLARHGVSWASREADTPEDLRSTLRRAINATALVACYVNQ
jgi:hypothetical protein